MIDLDGIVAQSEARGWKISLHLVLENLAEAHWQASATHTTGVFVFGTAPTPECAIENLIVEVISNAKLGDALGDLVSASRRRIHAFR